MLLPTEMVTIRYLAKVRFSLIFKSTKPFNISISINEIDIFHEAKYIIFSNFCRISIYLT